ncbi:hypothetical protein BCR37DRAFT_394983 [Protomyces lactucae-debilis]|uniref:Uncharacterized protein n=1 Tax=Protomyces lactucae-debilis TaxID=2754530 RepID=A0A1Y2F1Y8_PROLT|nr:uncharacterized protein BCR37DRAFT_394983 [Protomyces lactucae-debilis]ORY77366.1 hypothetical protein BCR37DRAFT_394983 [Protomyces lactucae-debilis]
MSRDTLYASLITAENGLATVKRQRKQTLPRARLPTHRESIKTAAATEDKEEEARLGHYNAQLQAKMRFESMRIKKAVAVALDAPKDPDAAVQSQAHAVREKDDSAVATPSEGARVNDETRILGTPHADDHDSVHEDDVEHSCFDLVQDGERQACVAMLETDLGPLPFWLDHVPLPSTQEDGASQDVSSPVPADFRMVKTPSPPPRHRSPVSRILTLTRKSLQLADEVKDWFAACDGDAALERFEPCRFEGTTEMPVLDCADHTFDWLFKHEPEASTPALSFDGHDTHPAGYFESLELLIEKLNLDKLADCRIRELEQDLQACRARLATLETRRAVRNRPMQPSVPCERLWQASHEPAVLQHGLWSRGQLRKHNAQQSRASFMTAPLHPNITPRSAHRWRRGRLALQGQTPTSSPRSADPTFYQYSDPSSVVNVSSPVPQSIRLSRARLFQDRSNAHVVSSLDSSQSSTMAAPTQTSKDHALSRLRVSKQHVARRGTIPKAKDFAQSSTGATACLDLPPIEQYLIPDPPVPTPFNTVRPPARMNPHLSRRLPFAPSEKTTPFIGSHPAQCARKTFSNKMHIEEARDASVSGFKTVRKRASPFTQLSPANVRPFLTSRNENQAPTTPRRTPAKQTSVSEIPAQTPKSSPVNICPITRSSGRIVSGQLAGGSPLQEQSGNALNNAAMTVRLRSPALTVLKTVRKDMSPLTVGRLSMTPIESPPARLKRRVGYTERSERVY